MNEPTPNPSREGMQPHRGLLFEDALRNRNSLIVGVGKVNAVVNHPSLESLSRKAGGEVG